jgi:hypothetical protein
MNDQNEAKLHAELDAKILELFRKLSPKKKTECLRHMEQTYIHKEQAGK